MIETTLLIFGLLTALVPIILLRIIRKKLFFLLLADSRLSRILHYLLMSILGASIFVESYSDFFHLDLILRFTLFFFLLFYAGMFAIVINNIEDVETDKLTNPQRPLVQSLIPLKDYRKIGVLCLIIAVFISLFIHQLEVFAILGMSVVYYLYSAKPLKLKRYVILAKLLIGINSLIAAVYGFAIVGGFVFMFPIEWAFFLTIPISLMANFVDLKDTEGDRIAHVNTLPVLLGNKKVTYLIAVFTVFTYTFASFLLDNLYIYFINLVCCLLHVYLLFRVPYNEKPLFILHNGLFIGLIVLLLILK